MDAPLADALTAEEAAPGLAEAQVMEAKSLANEKQGIVEANIIEKKAIADAKGIEAKAGALEKQGLAEANVLEQKGNAEAKVIAKKAASVKEQGLAEAEVMEKKGLAEALRIEARANATKKLDGVGKEHEEFKLRLQQVTDIELAKINIQKDIANAQASVISEALKASHINIVGGETMFYENIMGAITKGKSIDSFVSNSQVVQDVQKALMNGNGSGGSMGEKLKKLVNQFGLTSEDVKNLTISALLFKMLNLSSDDGTKGLLNDLMKKAKKDGVGDKSAGALL